jgi:hypothetical protein
MAAPTFSAVAQNMGKKKLAGAISEASGVDIKPKDVSVANFKAVEMDSTPQEQKVAEIKSKDKMSSQDKIYLALAAALPTVIGAAFGGAEGGAIGAKVTGDIAQTYGASLAEKQKSERERAEKLELAKIAAGTKSSEAELNRQNRIDTAQIMAGDRSAAREDKRLQDQRDVERKQLEKEADIERKKKDSVIELEDRSQTIEQNLKALKTMVEDTGGFDFAGPQNRQMEQLIDSIAVDMAKLVDPSSVARESEVAQAKKLLFEPGLFERESNILSVLDSFKDIAKRKRETAYKVRGLTPPNTPQFEPDVIKYAESHGITPEAALAIKNKRTAQ